ncbi:MAG: hypothetical protein ACJAXA_002075 [Candidatus Aldehydirespiratoraceae bacterium]|jgi:hypothetical protein
MSRLPTPRFYQRAAHISSVIVVTPDDADTISNAKAGRGLTDGDYGLEPNTRVFTPLRVLFVVGALAFASFWFWALFLIDKTSVNKIEDRSWAARAEAICEPVKMSVRRLNLQATGDLTARADLVVQSTDMMSDMLDDLISVEPADAKGQAIVPDWITDYRTLLQDRYDYADRLRDGQNVPYTETPVEGIPITERLESFAGDNEMPSCAPPRRGVLN